MLNFKQVLLAVVVVAVAAPAFGADMGVSQGHDLDALWAEAQKKFDTETEDAVLLLESREVTLNGDGTKSTRVHTVVWITSSVGIRGYADLRVPWDMATSELEVEVLRTWMDERWWPNAERISDTAVVHTLPHALRTAHDYTTMRETMLLHDGVELPCIMETVYTITEQMAFDHTDGLMVLPQRDPCVRVELTVKAPAGVEVKHEAMNGAPEVTVDNADGQLVMTWAMDKVAPLKMPITSAPERYEPAVVWSTWPSWEALRDAWLASIEPSLDIDEGLQKVKDEFRAGQPASVTPFPACRDWVNESVRAVGYDEALWFGRPRNVGHTYETGYGHALDRALLFSAMSGTESDRGILFFLGPAGDMVAGDIPRLTGIGDLMVASQGMGQQVYDPAHGTLLDAQAIQGRPWSLAEALVQPTSGASRPGGDVVELFLELGDDGNWTGHGACSLGPKQVGVESVVSGILPGVTLSSLQGDASFDFTFDLTVPVAEEDGNGSSRWVLGSLDSGALPRDVRLSDQVRQSPVILGAPLQQSIKVRMKGEGLTMPDPVDLENEAGSFSVKTFEEYGWTVIERSIELKQSRYEPGDWPALRALLLEEQDPRHGTIIFE